MRLLLAEDDRKLAHNLQRGLEEEGWSVSLAENGEDALLFLHGQSFAAVILDWMLPRLSGVDVLRQIRREGKAVPVLMLTANAAVHQRVAGLDAGADDYLTKPFALAELTARLRALTRRPAGQPVMQRQLGDLKLDHATRQAWRGGMLLDLTLKELQLLELFMRNAGRVVTRSIIADELWDLTFELGSNVIEVHVRNLRRKLEAQGGSRLIFTRRGMGYTMVLDGQTTEDAMP